MNFVPIDPIYNNSSLVQIMAWCHKCDKPLPEAIMTQLTGTQIRHSISSLSSLWYILHFSVARISKHCIFQNSTYNLEENCYENPFTWLADVLGLAHQTMRYVEPCCMMWYGAYLIIIRQHWLNLRQYLWDNHRFLGTGRNLFDITPIDWHWVINKESNLVKVVSKL